MRTVGLIVAITYCVLTAAGQNRQKTGQSNTAAGSATSNVRVGVGVGEPRATGPDAQCTAAARRDRIKGTSYFYLTVAPDGIPHKIRLTRSLRKDLDREALNA